MRYTCEGMMRCMCQGNDEVHMLWYEGAMCGGGWYAKKHVSFVVAS